MARGAVRRLLPHRLLLSLLLLVGLLLLGPVLLIGRRIPLNYNEGWNAYWAVRAVTAGAGPLYPPPSSLVFNNYPPLSFYAVGLLGRFVFGDMIVAGRVVALIALLSCGVLVGGCARSLGAGRPASMAAGLLLVLYACTFFRGYVAMDDPQWLGQALMLAGLATLLRGLPQYAPGTVAGAALLVLAGGLVKHSLIGLPVAVTVWLGLFDRRACLVWLGTAAAGLTLAALVLGRVHGDAMFADILLHRRVIGIGRIGRAAARLLPFLPMAALTGWMVRAQWRTPPVALAVLFVLIAACAGLVQSVGAGVNDSAQFETGVAVCLAFGLAAGERSRLVLAAALAPLLIVMPRRLLHAWDDVWAGPARAAAWRPVIARIAAAPGMAGCETLALCYWAGKPFAVDVFNLTQSVLTGGSIAPFAALARRHAFGVFQVVPRSPIHTDARPDQLLESLRTYYVPASVGPRGTLLLMARRAE